MQLGHDLFLVTTPGPDLGRDGDRGILKGGLGGCDRSQGDIPSGGGFANHHRVNRWHAFRQGEFSFDVSCHAISEYHDSSQRLALVAAVEGGERICEPGGLSIKEKALVVAHVF